MEVAQARCTEFFMRTAVWVDVYVRSDIAGANMLRCTHECARTADLRTWACVLACAGMYTDETNAGVCINKCPSLRGLCVAVHAACVCACVCTCLNVSHPDGHLHVISLP